MNFQDDWRDEIYTELECYRFGCVALARIVAAVLVIGVVWLVFA